MNTPEAKVKALVKKVLANSERFGYIHSWWPVPSGYGRSHVDCIGCYRGQFFCIETKAPGKKMTRMQRSVGSEVLESGGAVFEIDGDTSALEAWLEQVRETFEDKQGYCHPEGCTGGTSFTVE